MSRFIGGFTILVACMITVPVLAACSSPKTPSQRIPPATHVDRPGVYEADDGRMRVVGVLEWVDLEGGFFAVVDVAETEAAEIRVVAAIANVEEVQDELLALRGRYVEVLGEPFEGVSIRMVGPEIVAEEINPLLYDSPNQDS